MLASKKNFDLLILWQSLGIVAFLQSFTLAVVVSTTTENTVPPEDDPGFINTAFINDGSTAVYIGNRWVLSAAHVGRGPVEFPGLGTFRNLPHTETKITNPPELELEDFADLILFKLAEDPELPSLRISRQSPESKTEVLMIGGGKDRITDGTYWNVVRSGNEFVWTETEETTRYFGYSTMSSNTIRWGTNLVESDERYQRSGDDDNNISVRQSTRESMAFATEFDASDTVSNGLIRGPDRKPFTEHESQAVLNDSGGPVFFKNADDSWVLGGIMVAVDGHSGQPNVRRTAVFGNSTFSVDLAYYHDQINAVYLQGDFDGDLHLNHADLDLLSAEARLDDPNVEFDLNSDGFVDSTDRDVWVRDLKVTFYGDSNLDGEFNTRDFIDVFVAGEYEDDIDGNSTWATGDWDGDGDFTTGDFIIALTEDSFEVGPRVIEVVNVPEPPYYSVAPLLFLLILSRRIVQ